MPALNVTIIGTLQCVYTWYWYNMCMGNIYAYTNLRLSETPKK